MKVSKSDRDLLHDAIYALRRIQDMCDSLTHGNVLYNGRMIKNFAKECENQLDKSMDRNIKLETEREFEEIYNECLKS